MEKAVLFYNLYPKSIWKELTLKILRNVPHDQIVVHVAETDGWFRKRKRRKIEKFLLSIPKVSRVFFSANNPKLGEVVGFRKMLAEVDISGFDVLTYMHSKGVTKPDNVFVQDWVELMRYFQVEKFDLCLKAFSGGFHLYGVKIATYEGPDEQRKGPFRYCDFWYGGTFVSANLKALHAKILQTPVPDDYYGVEGFWGQLTSLDRAFCAHQTPSLYNEPYPEHLYKDAQHLNNT
jgi:hypothetical protein